MRYQCSNMSGFGLVETAVGAAVISTVLLGLAGIAQFAFRTADEANLRLRASLITEEGLEVARLLRDTSWSQNIADLSTTSDYYLRFSASNGWEATTTPQPLVDDAFDRRLRIADVRRNATDDIVSGGGTYDPDTKQVAVTASWSRRGRSATTTLTTYLANLFGN